MRNILFLDDEESRRRAFLSRWPYAQLVKSAFEAVFYLPQREWDLVSLDHDLDDGFDVFEHANTGMRVVQWICEHRPIIHKVVVHSLNTPAAHEMRLKLQDAGYSAVTIPFFWTMAPNDP